MFQLDLDAKELRRHGTRIKLQGKPFHVLEALLETPGDVVSREDLRRRLWPDDTFVDFDNGLNTAVKRLRIALGDSAANPLYIETLSRTGYRFIAPVEREVIEQAIAPSEPGSAIEAIELPRQASRRRLSGRLIVALALAALTAGVLFVHFKTSADSPVKYLQLTFRRGQVSSARFAPQGRDIVYSARWENRPDRTFVTNIFSPEARVLGFSGARLVAVFVECGSAASGVRRSHAGRRR